MMSFVKTITVEHLLAFATGSSQQPASGFKPTPKIVFVHDISKQVPAAQTCPNELILFVNENNLDLTTFAINMVTSLMNGSVFSKG